MSQNNETNGMIFALAIVATIAMFAAAIVFALAAFAAIALTVVAIAAWNEPVTLFGETTTPDEARAFVARGIMGMVIAPLFCLFSAALFDLSIDEGVWLYVILGGYSAGSLGIEILIEQEREKTRAEAALIQEILPPLPAPPQMQTQPQTQTQPIAPTERQEPFIFADWNDEEELR